MKIKDVEPFGLNEDDMFKIFDSDEIRFCGTCNEYYFGTNECPCNDQIIDIFITNRSADKPLNQ